MRNSTSDIHNEVVESLNSLAYNGQTSKFKKIFNILTYHHKQCYLHTTIMKCHAKVMYCILSSIKRDEALSVLYDLFQEKKGFAFNTLDVIAHQSTFLFRTLFSQLNSQQKEDYKIYLEIKSTVSAKHILERFYSNDKRKPKTENSNAKNSNTDSRLLRQRKKPTQNGFLTLNNSASFLPNSATLEETTDQHEIEPLTVNWGLTSEEYQDMLSESDNRSFDELIYWVTGEQLSNSLQLSILKKFNELEEVIIEPAAKRQRIL
ncbi:hypothetical protein [Wolbachia pipientis]|uniref:hypothetical protein n=1 Tax=Wolbachia pipientis TaxID=955 RepID=UPI00202FA31E|nr:hypothetical protein [Wolbachia pipientis]MCM1001764.1 hypothetical protein [Wolbachia pipientis]